MSEKSSQVLLRCNNCKTELRYGWFLYGQESHRFFIPLFCPNQDCKSFGAILHKDLAELLVEAKATLAFDEQDDSNPN